MLKYIVLCLFYTYNVFAVSELRSNTLDHFVQVNEQRELRAGEPAWSEYLVDECLEYNLSIQNEDELREIGLRRCLDKSVSFIQPASRGVGGWEGKCGHTYGANALFTMCKKAVAPLAYFGSIFGDLTPGVRPGTLRKGLSQVFRKVKENCPTGQGNWIYYKLGNSNNFIKRVKQFIIPKYSHINLQRIQRDGKEYSRNPIGALIQNPGGKYIHWVMIVDQIEKNNTCHFVINHWDNQYEVPCETFAKWSGRVGRTYPIILKSYSIVSFN